MGAPDHHPRMRWALIVVTFVFAGCGPRYVVTSAPRPPPRVVSDRAERFVPAPPPPEALYAPLPPSEPVEPLEVPPLATTDPPKPPEAATAPPAPPATPRAREPHPVVPSGPCGPGQIYVHGYMRRGRPVSGYCRRR